MPRTIAVDCPGCPAIRALSFDVLGLIKVIEARSTATNPISTPKVVERWGEPDASRSILTASLIDREFNPLLAVARKNGQIEVISPLNGEACAPAITGTSDNDTVTGLHLFRKEPLEASSSSNRSCKLLTCSMKGTASIRSIKLINSPTDSTSADTPTTWDVCKSGDVLFSAVDENENYSLFGGKGVEVNIWDLDKTCKIWTAKAPPANSLGIFTPTFFTAGTFLDKEDHRKIVAGTNNHQVRLYDISTQRRPVLSLDFRESAIKAVTGDIDGHTIYLGTGSGDLASVDMRTGKLLGCFLGKCSGSIRSIARHPVLPMIASCGLDSYLRIWDVKTRQLLSAVFLKQHVTSVLIDSNFSGEAIPDAAESKGNQVEQEEEYVKEEVVPPVKRKKVKKSKQVELDEEEAFLPVKRKKAKKTNQVELDEEAVVPVKTKKPKKANHVEQEEEEGERRKASKESNENKKLKLKKKSKKRVQVDAEEE